MGNSLFLKSANFDAHRASGFLGTFLGTAKTLGQQMHDVPSTANRISRYDFCVLRRSSNTADRGFLEYAMGLARFGSFPCKNRGRFCGDETGTQNFWTREIASVLPPHRFTSHPAHRLRRISRNFWGIYMEGTKTLPSSLVVVNTGLQHFLALLPGFLFGGIFNCSIR